MGLVDGRTGVGCAPGAESDVFDAALPLCGSVAGALPMLNGSLDGTYALKTLLAPRMPGWSS